MKKFFLFSAAAISSMFFVSCEDTTLDVDVPFEHTITKNVFIPVAADTVFINDTTTIDASINAELEDKIDKVKSLEIDRVELSISNLSSTAGIDSVKANATVALLYGDFLEQEIFADKPYGPGFVSLQDLLDGGTVTRTAADLGVTNLEEALNILQAAGKLSVIVDYAGVNLTENTYSFDTEIKIYFKAVASITE